MLNCLVEVVLQDVSKYYIVIHRVLHDSKNKRFVLFSCFRKTRRDKKDCFHRYLMVQTSESEADRVCLILCSYFVCDINIGAFGNKLILSLFKLCRLCLNYVTSLLYSHCGLSRLQHPWKRDFLKEIPDCQTESLSLRNYPSNCIQHKRLIIE